jgi:hypothetical protein
MYGVEGGTLRKSRPRGRREGASTTVLTRQVAKAAHSPAPASERIEIASLDGAVSSIGTELHVPAGYDSGLPLSTSNLLLRNDDDVQGLLSYCVYSKIVLLHALI